MKKAIIILLLILFSSFCFAEAKGNVVIEKNKTVITKSEINRENVSAIVKSYIENGYYVLIQKDSSYHYIKWLTDIIVKDDSIFLMFNGSRTINYSSISEIRLDKDFNLIIKEKSELNNDLN